MSQEHDLHRALLRPAIIHILRAAGFQSTRPSVLDTLTNVAERYLLLLCSTTAQHALNSHNDPVPTITDARMAMVDCGILVPTHGAAEEEWKELMRIPIEELGRAIPDKLAGQRRMTAEKRKRDEEDLKDVRDFTNWFDGKAHHEMKRIAGMVPDDNATGQLPAVGVGGGTVSADDFLAVLKKKFHGGKAGVVDENSRLAGTVLGRSPDDRPVIIEGGPVQSLAAWKPRFEAPKDAPSVAATEQPGISAQTEDKGAEDGDTIDVQPSVTAAAG